MTFKVFSLLPLLFFNLITIAQKQKDNKAPLKEKTKEIVLQKFPDKGFPAGTYPIANISLIQAVPDSTRLGYIKNGNDIKVTAVPDRPLTEYFQTYINNKFSGSYDKTGLHFLWVVKNIRVSQRDFDYQSKAYLYFNADAYASKDGNNYNFITNVDTVLVNDDMAYDATEHYHNMREAFRILLQKTIDRGAGFIASAAAENFSIPGIRNKEMQRFNHPACTDSVYVDGVYSNYSDFLNNRPSFIHYKTAVIDKKEVAVIINEKDTVQAWGICAKGQLYKYYEKRLVSIEKQGNGFIISNYVAAVNQRNNNMVTAGLFGDFVLGVAGNIISKQMAKKMSEKIIIVSTIPYIKKKPPEACTVNVETGEWFF